MTNVINSAADIPEADKQKLFWASFLALTAAGVGFVFRVMIPDMWASNFQITLADVGVLTGAALWPIAITMILFSLLVDKIGYKVSMFFAFALQAISVVLTYFATDFNTMWWACFCAGLGHGVVEAVINPLCASIYRESKSKMLNILHASWPAGIVLGGVFYLLLANISPDTKWAEVKWVFWFMLLPVLAYGALFAMCHRFPVDERVEANVSMGAMLKEFGGLGAFLAATFLLYEIFGQVGVDKWIQDQGWGSNARLWICLGLGAAIGTVVGFAVGSPGKILFFVLCLIMIPLATAELATDNWIRQLMKPILGEQFGGEEMGSVLSGWAIVCSAGIMMFLRFFAGIPLKFMSPPMLLLVSSLFSIVGLYALSVSTGMLIFLAFVLYAVGQTFYWPTVLGFVSEQFPRGGAMTLNTVSAMGLLTVGIFGFPFLGAVQDHYTTQTIIEKESEMFNTVKAEKKTFVDKTNPEKPEDKPIYELKNFFGVKYDSVNSGEFKKLLEEKNQEALDKELTVTSQSSLKVAAVLPLIMAIAFILILVYYAMTGGYKPVVLADEVGKDQK